MILTIRVLCCLLCPPRMPLNSSPLHFSLFSIPLRCAISSHSPFSLRSYSISPSSRLYIWLRFSKPRSHFSTGRVITMPPELGVKRRHCRPGSRLLEVAIGGASPPSSLRLTPSSLIHFKVSFFFLFLPPLLVVHVRISAFFPSFFINK